MITHRCSVSSIRRRGFTMIESLMAVSVTTIAGAALLTSVTSAVQSTTVTTRSMVAEGLAEQLLDEIAAARFSAESATQQSLMEPTLVSTFPSESRRTRENFRNIDDYTGWTSSPPVDHWGIPLGSEGYTIRGYSLTRLTSMRPNRDYLDSFSREVLVEQVEPDGDAGWRTVSRSTEFRRVTVRINYQDANSATRTVAELSRIFTYVSVSP